MARTSVVTIFATALTSRLYAANNPLDFRRAVAEINSLTISYFSKSIFDYKIIKSLCRRHQRSEITVVDTVILLVGYSDTDYGNYGQVRTTKILLTLGWKQCIFYGCKRGNY